MFLKNHLADLVSIDFFTIPTVNFKVLFVLIVLSHHRRKVIHFNVTENPTAQWAAQQIVEAFPWDSAPKYLLRDCDAIYGETFSRHVASLGIEQVLSAPRSPWQNPYVERLIGTLRRECFDHVIVLNVSQARRILIGCLHYYHRWRTHLVGDGFAGLTTCTSTRAGRSGGICGGRWLASPLRADGSMTWGDSLRRVAHTSFREGQ